MSRIIDVRAVLDRPQLGGFRRRVLALCWIIAVLDGFDVQAMAFVAPVLAREWGSSKEIIGWMLTAGIVGLLLGSFFLGRLSDRIGRRPVLLGSVLLFGVASLCTAASQGELQIMLLRMITGIGLGGVTVAALSLMSEYAPERSRATVVIAMYVGFPIGGSLAGLLATPLIASFGWQGLFVLGGIMPLLLIAAVWRLLPESLRFDVARGADAASIGAVVGRIAPDYSYRAGDRFVVEERMAMTTTPLAELFSRRWLPATSLLWLIAFANLLVLYALINWLPSILSQAGFSQRAANLGAVAFNLGGVAGSLLLGVAADRLGAFRALTVAYVLAAVFTWMLSGAQSAGVAFGLTLLAGAGVIGAQFCVNALATVIYPTAIRATGVGSMLGFGRIGSMAGPLIGGIALGAGASPRTMLALAALPLVVCCAAVPLLGAVKRTKAQAHSAVREPRGLSEP
jgi:AAHS family 4-hydroxybenzoate transporter-like MFS transporter